MYTTIINTWLPAVGRKIHFAHRLACPDILQTQQFNCTWNKGGGVGSVRSPANFHCVWRKWIVRVLLTDWRQPGSMGGAWTPSAGHWQLLASVIDGYNGDKLPGIRNFEYTRWKLSRTWSERSVERTKRNPMPNPYSFLKIYNFSIKISTVFVFAVQRSCWTS